MSGSDKSNKNKSIWKNLKEYNGDPEYLKTKTNEFVEGVTEDFDPEEMNGLSRRKFLALVTASTAFAATACSDYHDKGEIIPYTNRPDNVLPGTADYYASSDHDGTPLLVKTREGRPIKVDGNPEHPINKGKAAVSTQASVMNLYDPNRLQFPLLEKRKTTWKKADEKIVEALNKADEYGKKIAIVTHKIKSPAATNLLSELKKKYKTADIYSYELFDNANRINAWKKCYRSVSLPSVKWDKAKIILALESDFLAREGETVENIRLFTESRDVMKSNEFNRLYVVEGGMSLTGMNSDYRLRVRPDKQLDFVMSLLNEIVVDEYFSSLQLNSTIINMLSNYSLKNFAERNQLSLRKLTHLIKDLIESKGSAIVYAGDTLPENVHIAVNLLNEVLGNTTMYDFEHSFISDKLENKSNFENLIADLNINEVGLLLHIDANPVYHLPKDYKYAEAMKKADLSVTLCESVDETAELCSFALPVNHALESWNYFQTRKGIFNLQQPVIAPLYKTRQAEAVILNWLSEESAKYTEDIYHKYVRDLFEKEVYSKSNSAVDFQTYWYSALHDGFVQISEENEILGRFNLSAAEEISKISESYKFVLHLQPSYYLADGRYSNNGWMQEIPHPVSKVAWDNYAAVSPSTAKSIKVVNGDMIKISSDGAELEMPAFVQPGMADNLLVVELGYGRTIIGEAGLGVGFNANVFLSEKSSFSKWIITDASVAVTGGKHKLVSTQEHHALDDEFVKDFHKIRNIIKEGTVEEYQKHPTFLKHGGHEIFSITEEREYTGNKWAMSIDLNKCISCGACAASCNVENNIPVVGKDQVAVGREMHWIRLDRYYSGTPDDPEVSNQPMVCQHCDNAPCENVCPVNATNHSPDGLNQMAYNRCVGTRYCANNCPYKVRRFNFFNFRDHFADEYYEAPVMDLVNNPEVTVRSRGVMEKCTFCVQRIMEARSNAIRDGKELNGSDISTACQEACPSNAIVFGDANDPESEISQYRKHELGYHVLEELNVKPNVTYIAKLRNTHSEDA